jgi:D-alanyl-D-alanine endopeptidase (penicillin-binding protein 7)
MLEVLAQLSARAAEETSVSQVAEVVTPPRPDPIPVVVVAAARPEPLPVVDARLVPTPVAPVSKLDIKEPDRELAERFVRLRLTSAAALVVDQEEGNLLYAKNPDAVRSIASITKLMTAMVALDAALPLDDRLTVQPADVRISKGKESRLKVGVSLTRREMLKLALMSSENRAAAAVARTYPGGTTALVEAMNQKAQALGMTDTHFLEPTGLDARNVSTAHDLALMVNAAYGYPLIREFTTSDLHEVPAADRRHRSAVTYYYNSNRLVRDSEWDVGLSKTGYIGKAGRCLVMQATIAAKPVIIVLLDSLGKVSRVADANRIKHWLEGPDLAMPARMRDKPHM